MASIIYYCSEKTDSTFMMFQLIDRVYSVLCKKYYKNFALKVEQFHYFLREQGDIELTI